MQLNMFKSVSPTSNNLQLIANKIVAITAGKGGAGKLTLSTKLGSTLRLTGKKVGLLGAGIYGLSLKGALKEDRAPREVADRLEPTLAQGLQRIFMAHFEPAVQAWAIRAPMADQFIEQFLFKVNRCNRDFLTIDLPSSTGDIVLTLSQKGFIDCTIVVSTPQQVACEDTERCIDPFEQVNVSVLGLVENKVYLEHAGQRIYSFAQGGVQHPGLQRGYPILALRALDPLVCKCSDKRSPFVADYSTHVIYKQIEALAQKLVHFCSEFKESIEPFYREWRPQ